MTTLAARRDAPPMALVTILAMVTMLFATFTASYLIRKTGSDWGPLPMPSVFWWNTAILAASSFLLIVGRRGGAVFLGVLFLAGQIFAWTQLAGQGVFLSGNPHASFLYVLTALHGLHLIGGVAALLSGRAKPQCDAYWHFMGLVWIWVMVLLWVI